MTGMTQEQYDNRLERAHRHANQDMLLGNTYGKIFPTGKFKGCSVGCDAYEIAGYQATKYNPHKTVSENDGTPFWLEFLRDIIFEGLDPKDKSWWHVQLAKSLPINTSFQPAYHLIQISILEIALEIQDEWAEPYKSKCIKSIKQIINLHKKQTAADSAAWSTAQSAAWSVAWSAERAAQSAARSAARGAENAAQSAAYKRIAINIIDIFKSMKMELEA